MAVLTGADIKAIWRDLYRLGHGKEELKAKLSPRDKRLGILQAVEDDWVAGRTARKAAMDTAAGRTLTAAEARVYQRGWLSLRGR